ncbi:MAG: hypothetical protein V2A79_04685 [Planctomycetota bacterium]
MDLAPTVVLCAADAECAAAFGESWARCEAGKCKAGYLDRLGTGRPNSWCAGGCVAGDTETTTPNYYWFAVHATFRRDGGMVYYGGMLVLDIPAGARGKYIVDLNRDETFLAGTCVWCDVSSAEENGFVVNIIAGQ